MRSRSCPSPTDLGIPRSPSPAGSRWSAPDVVDVWRHLADLPRAPHPVGDHPDGLRLTALARAARRGAGLSRVNISCDTLSPETFRRLTLRDRLDDVLAGMAAARAAGLAPIKINTVLMRGVNDHEAAALLRWALDEGLSLRFIEQMPLDPQHGLEPGDDGHPGGDPRLPRACRASTSRRCPGAGRPRPRSSRSTAGPPRWASSGR